MNHTRVQLKRKQAEGSVISPEPVNLVAVITDTDMVGSRAFDVQGLESFSYPATRPSQGSSIANIEDLLQGIIKEANPVAEKRGLKAGLMSRVALELL